MKIRPVILCGGAGTRLWPNAKKHQAKQFIDFGNWTLLGKTLERVKASIFDAPIISTNAKYLRQVKQHLKKHKIRKFKIVLEPAKRNTAPAILSTALIKDIPNEQPLMFLTADHLIEKVGLFNKAIKKNQKKLTQNNIFIFGIKPTMPSSEFGYFLTKNNKVSRFIEKPKKVKAKQIINKKGFLNSGMFYFTSRLDPELVARKMEINDNVIPASNSVMANVLYDLGTLLDNDNYKQKAIIMANNVKPDMAKYASGYANYANLMLKEIVPYYEVAIVGKDAHTKAMELNKKYVPNKLFVGSFENSNMELLQEKFVQGITMIYVCENKACQLPTNNIMQAQKLMK